MSEPTAPTDPPKRTSLVKCERHGLHYDPAKMSGCVICRREAGGALPAPSVDVPGATVGAVPGVAAAAVGGSGSGSLAAPLLVAAGLCLGMAFALYELHGAVGAYVRTGGGYTGEEMPEVSTDQSRQMEEALKELNDVGGTPETSAAEDDAVEPDFADGPE